VQRVAAVLGGVVDPLQLINAAAVTVHQR
jgi:hypothetical protein